MATPTLQAGQAARIGAGEEMRVRELGTDAERVMSWTRGRVWLDRATLGDAVAATTAGS